MLWFIKCLSLLLTGWNNVSSINTISIVELCQKEHIDSDIRKVIKNMNNAILICPMWSINNLMFLSCCKLESKNKQENIIIFFAKTYLYHINDPTYNQVMLL